MFAASGGHLAVVVFLIDSGANARTSINPLGYSYRLRTHNFLDVAAYRGHLDVVNLLLEHWKIIDDAKFPVFALGWTAYRGHLDVVNLLLDDGLDAQSQSPAW